MKAPIIVINRGDVLLFSSVVSAENYLEPFSVADDIYEAYDSCGLSLTCEVQYIRSWIGDKAVIKLVVNEPNSTSRLELRLHLISFFVHNPQLFDVDESIFAVPLDDLVEKIKSFKSVLD